MLFGWVIVMTTQAITAQGPVQIACGAKDVHSAKKGFVLGGFLIFPIGFLSAILGMAALAQFPDINPTKALPQIVMSLDPLASGLTLAALWAADVSTACTILLGAGTLVSQDIYKRFINPNVSDEGYMKANRLIILIIGVVTLWMAFNMVGIVKMMMIGLSLTTAFTLVFLCTMPPVSAGRIRPSGPPWWASWAWWSGPLCRPSGFSLTSSISNGLFASSPC